MSRSQSKKFVEKLEDLKRIELAKEVCLKAEVEELDVVDDSDLSVDSFEYQDRAIAIVDSETRNIIEEQFPEAKVIDRGVGGKEAEDKKFMARVLDVVEVEKPSFIFSFFGSESKVGKRAVEEYFEFRSDW